MVELLISNGATIDSKIGMDTIYECSKKTSLLFNAYNMDCQRAVELLLKSGADINKKKNENGRCLLEQAIKDENKGMVELLISNGATIDSKMGMDTIYECSKKTSLLFYAYNMDCQHAVEMLLKSGADINQKNEKGRCLLAQAIIDENKGMVELLISYGATIDSKMGMDTIYECSKKTSLLFNAYNMDCQSAVEMLLNSGADINQKNENGRCLLEQAIKDENKGMVELLISNGATIDSIIEGKLWGLNNIHTKLKQDYLGKIGEFIMIHTMKKMITQRNNSEAPTIHDLSATEKQIIEGIMYNTDDVHLYHTGCIGHATCTLKMTGETKYLIHTNKGYAAKENTDGKARPMVICSKDDSEINDVKNKLLRFLQTEKSMGRPNQMLEHFQSDGGNQQFIKAVESVAAKSQTMGNCWIKSYNQALKIRLFIGFLKANRFNFDENSGDDDTLKNALKNAKTLFRKIRLARVEASIRMVELKRGKSEAGTQQDEDLLTNLKRKRVKINDKILGKIYDKIIIRNIV